MAKEKKRIPLIRFDWAMKKILRQKANHDILEGFLSELLKENIKITKILESEGNQEHETDKYNRVDIFVENDKGELLIIEVQNTKEFDYFHRILYGVSKSITEYIQQSDKYSQVKKVISITIAYFELGQGKDYVYHGTTNFVGIHKKDTLALSLRQKNLYNASTPSELYPEYWLLKVGNFNNKINDTLDEWIYFFKNAEVIEGFHAKGLAEAKAKLDEMKLNEEERKAYNGYKRRLHDVASEEYNKELEIRFAIEDAEAKIKAEAEAEKKAMIAEKKEMIAKAKAEKKAMIAEKKEMIAEKKEMIAKAEAEKKAMIAEKKEMIAKAEAEKKEMIAKAEAQKQEMILNFHKIGVSVKDIAVATQKTEAEVQQIIASHTSKK